MGQLHLQEFKSFLMNQILDKTEKPYLNRIMSYALRNQKIVQII
jgi:DNA-binding protein Fis